MSLFSTPPPTTLDTPSPTEQELDDTELRPDEMAKAAKPIYLVVATAISPPLGIGFKGTLPWPQIKSDMAFFRKVTSSNATTGTRNAVIMGRKTWESIPAKFRPLPERINVVLTRADADGIYEMGEQIGDEYRRHKGLQPAETRFTVDNNDDGTLYSLTRNGDRQPIIQITNSLKRAVDVGNHPECGNVFCIGGAEIYKMILQEKETKDMARVLQTLVKKQDGSEYDCDTFFPEQLQTNVGGWKQVTTGEVKDWIEVDLPQGDSEWAKDDKAGVEIKVIGWSRE